MPKPDDKIYRALIEAMLHLDVDYTEGAGTTDQALPKATCPQCRQVGGVAYTGSDMIEGSLTHYHLVHTEVDHHLRCTHCGAGWRVFKML